MVPREVYNRYLGNPNAYNLYMTSNSVDDLKSGVVTYLRDLEVMRAQGDRTKLHQIESMNDEELLRKWLWIGGLGGGLVCFVVLPIIFKLAGMIVPYLFMEILWTVLRLAMGISLVLLGLAIYVTVKHKQS
jgi:hypothetical protein